MTKLGTVKLVLFCEGPVDLELVTKDTQCKGEGEH